MYKAFKLLVFMHTHKYVTQPHMTLTFVYVRIIYKYLFFLSNLKI